MELTCEDCGVIFQGEFVTAHVRCQDCFDAWCDDQDTMAQYEEDDYADRNEAY